MKKKIAAESEWADVLPLIDFQYNCSPHAAWNTEPYKAMFGSLPFEFDDSLTLGYHLGRKDKHVELWERLNAVHKAMYILKRSVKIRWLKTYDEAIKEIPYEVGMEFTCRMERLK